MSWRRVEELEPRKMLPGVEFMRVEKDAAEVILGAVLVADWRVAAANEGEERGRRQRKDLRWWT